MNKTKVDSSSLETLKGFLHSNKLPFEDIILNGNEFFIYENGGDLIGSCGLEFYGDYALLRSLATKTAVRGTGLGKEILKDIIGVAKKKSVKTIYLLTETAPVFFEKNGFRKQSREEAPTEIKSSSEFSSVCPVSAVLMYLEI